MRASVALWSSILVSDLVPPITLNFLRWLIAFFILLPLAWKLLQPSSPLWPSWRRFAILSVLGVGLYNALQYLALHTSTPLNVTLVAGSTPVFMLAIGALFFKTPVRPAQWLGAALSIGGVLVVLSRGDLQQIMQVSFVVGDIYILLATLCWALYSWLLTQRNEPDEIRGNWALFLMAQVIFGLGWAGMFAGAEWALTDAHIVWGPPLFAALIFVSVGPAVLAYRCWGLGVQTAGPAVAGFFANLTPLFAAIMSSVFLGDLPKVYHAVTFGLIVSGIWVSSRRAS